MSFHTVFKSDCVTSRVLIIATLGILFPAVTQAEPVSALGELTLRQPTVQGSVARFNADVLPLLDRYCLHCHSSDDPSGGITLDRFDHPEQLLRDVPTWLAMARTQRHRQMPPSGEDQPEDAERQVLAEWAEGLAKHLDEMPPTDPGPMVFRRLNRNHYNQTMKDLLGIEFDVAAAVGLPPDPTAFGFDNIATALDIPPLLMEKYIAAADEALGKAVDTKPPTHTFAAAELPVVLQGEMPEGKSKDGPPPPASEVKDGYLLLRVNGRLDWQLEIPRAGTYRIEIEAWGHKGPKWIKWQGELGIQLAGQLRKSIKLLGTRDKPSTETATLYLPQGTQELGLTFLNAVHGPGWSENDDRFRHVGIKQIRVTGPVSGSGEAPDAEAHRRIFFVEPSDTLPANEAAAQIVGRFAGRAFRRPVSAEETARLLAIYHQADEQGLTFEESVRYALKGVLLSPHFLFRIEQHKERRGSIPPTESSPTGNDAERNGRRGLTPPLGDEVARISDFELATRLSYFLWGTLPDERLTELAAENRLRDPETLKGEVQRMLADDRSHRFIDDFARQWLHLDELDHALPSEEFFPEFTAKARASMRTEILMFLRNLVAENRSVLDLIDSDYSFTNRDLTFIYRYGGYQNEFERVEINKRRNPERGGLLGMGGILAMTSHVARNSPTRRGQWVLSVLAGTPVPPPPDNVELIEEGADKNQAKSFREQLAIHADESSTCAGCHKRMDPLGFALDQFNPIGKFERERGGEPIDASGTLPDGREVNGIVELKQILLADQDRFVRNLTQQLMTYALGRQLDYYDRPSVARIIESAQDEKYPLPSLILGVVESYPFQHHRGLEP